MMRSIGYRVHNALMLEGGYVWTHSDGRKTVHFNTGCKPSTELVKMLKEFRGELKDYVDYIHARDQAEGVSVKNIARLRLDILKRGECGGEAPGKAPG